jgi:hypothetical protein
MSITSVRHLFSVEILGLLNLPVNIIAINDLDYANIPGVHFRVSEAHLRLGKAAPENDPNP